MHELIDRVDGALNLATVLAQAGETVKLLREIVLVGAKARGQRQNLAAEHAAANEGERKAGR
ncbi:MAG: hypothetical protein WBS22_06385 [Methylocystis sp.]